MSASLTQPMDMNGGLELTHRKDNEMGVFDAIKKRRQYNKFVKGVGDHMREIDRQYDEATKGLLDQFGYKLKDGEIIRKDGVYKCYLCKKVVDKDKLDGLDLCASCRKKVLEGKLND